MWRRLIKVFKDSLGSSEKGNSCHMALRKACCMMKHDMAGVYRLWKAQRSYVIQTPLHNVLLDISFVKKKKKETKHGKFHTSPFCFKKQSQFLCTLHLHTILGLLSFFLLVMALKFCIMLCFQQGRLVIFFLTPPISHFFLGHLE